MTGLISRHMQSWLMLLAGVAIGAAVVAGSSSNAEENPKSDAATEKASSADLQLNGKTDAAQVVKKEYGSEVEAYCANIVDSARDQRYLIQKRELGDLQVQVNDRIKMLEQRRDEFQTWLKKRDDFLRVAEGTLVEIYKKMKPDAAATQLALVNPEIAAAVIMNLDARLSSSILNEMEADKAAMLAGIIADAASRDLPKEPS